MSGEIPKANSNGAEPKKGNPPRPPVIVRIFRYFKRKNDRRRQSEKQQNAHDRNEAMMALWTRRVGIFTIVIAIISGVSAVIFRGQQNIMQGQLEQMAADQRPWLYTDSPTFAQEIKRINGVWVLSLNFPLHNTGHLPAIHVWPIVMAPAPVGIAMPDVLRGQRHLCSGVSPQYVENTGDTVFPGQTVIRNYLAVSIAEKDWDTELRQYGGTGSPLIVGCFAYQAPKESEIHYSGFAYQIGWAVHTDPDDWGPLPSEPNKVPLKRLRAIPYEAPDAFAAN